MCSRGLCLLYPGGWLSATKRWLLVEILQKAKVDVPAAAKFDPRSPTRLDASWAFVYPERPSCFLWSLLKRHACVHTRTSTFCECHNRQTVLSSAYTPVSCTRWKRIKIGNFASSKDR